MEYWADKNGILSLIQGLPGNDILCNGGYSGSHPRAQKGEMSETAEWQASNGPRFVTKDNSSRSTGAGDRCNSLTGRLPKASDVECAIPNKVGNRYVYLLKTIAQCNKKKSSNHENWLYKDNLKENNAMHPGSIFVASQDCHLHGIQSVYKSKKRELASKTRL